MAAYNSSSLVARDGPSIFKTSNSKKSKQDKMVKIMFKSKHGKAPIGKKFRKHGKDVGNKKPITAKGVGPSEEEFDNMINETSKVKKGAKRKFFG